MAPLARSEMESLKLGRYPLRILLSEEEVRTKSGDGVSAVEGMNIAGNMLNQ